MSKKSKRFTLMKLGDAMFESSHLFFWTIVSDNGEWNNAKFSVGDEFFFIFFVDTYKFRDLSSCASGIYRRGYGIYGGRKWISVVERIKI